MLYGSMDPSSCRYYLLPHLLAQIWEVSWDLCCWHCAYKWCHGTVVEALTPHGMSHTHTSTPNIYIQSDWQPHMLWMGVWRSHHALLPNLLAQIQIWEVNWTVSLVCPQLMPWHSSNWGAKPSWNGSHIHSKHIPETRRWLTTFICCGWEYGSIIMPLPPHLLAKISLVSGNYGSLLDGKWCRGAAQWLRLY